MRADGSEESVGFELPPRARRMAERVTRAALEAGIKGPPIGALVEALRVGMEPRASGPTALSSDHDPSYLHPGRTVLILLGDLEERDPGLLAVGALAESRLPALRVTSEAAGTALDEPYYETWRDLPAFDWSAGGGRNDPDLVEALVTAEAEVQRIALAEALDQLRHAHLWPLATERHRAVTLAEDVLAPFAQRVHPVLERRFNWWIRRVANKLRFERE